MKNKVKASLLLESLLALFIFSLLVNLVLMEVDRSQRSGLALQKAEEELIVVGMALQSGRSSLHINGVQVQIQKSDKGMRIYTNQKEVIRIEESN